MASQPITVLYPEPLPADTPGAREATKTNLPPGTNIVRETFEDLNDVPKSIADVTTVLMIYKLHVRAEHFNHFPKLKVIMRLGVGVERVDIDAAEAKGVTVHNTPAYGSPAVAVHAVTTATALAENQFGYHDEIRDAPTIVWDPTATAKSRAPWDLTFGVLGYGRIGKAAAHMAKALGYSKVVYYDIKTFDPEENIAAVRSLEQLLHMLDVLSIHVPDTPETRNMIGDKEIGMLSKDAIIVNTARGRVLNLDAVEKYLKSGHLRAVGLDVLPEEPPTDENMHSLLCAYRRKEEWLQGRMQVTPHSASHSPKSFENIHIMSAKTAAKVLGGAKDTFRVRSGGF